MTDCWTFAVEQGFLPFGGGFGGEGTYLTIRTCGGATYHSSSALDPAYFPEPIEFQSIQFVYGYDPFLGVNVVFMAASIGVIGFQPYIIDLATGAPIQMPQSPLCIDVSRIVFADGIQFYFFDALIPSTPVLATPDPTNANQYITSGQPCTCCCVHPSTLVPTSRGIVPIHQIRQGDQVYAPDSTLDRTLVTVLFNARFAIPTAEFIRIQANAIAPNQPSADLLIREAHPVVISGREVPCEELINHSSIHRDHIAEPVYVHTLVTSKRVPVTMQGIGVMTYEKADFHRYMIDHSIPYTAQ